MKSIEQEIIRWFEAEDGIWVVDSAKTVEGILLKKAVQRIEELKEDLEDAQALADDWDDHFDEAVNDALSDYTEQRDHFADAYHKTLTHVLKMQAASEAFTKQCMNFLDEEGSDE